GWLAHAGIAAACFGRCRLSAPPWSRAWGCGCATTAFTGRRDCSQETWDRIPILSSLQTGLESYPTEKRRCGLSFLQTGLESYPTENRRCGLARRRANRVSRAHPAAETDPPRLAYAHGDRQPGGPLRSRRR